MANYQGLEGRSAIVTGASSGMGAATARRLAAEGVDLVLLAIPKDQESLELLVEELSADGAIKAVSVVGDIADPDTSARTVQAALDHCGGIDLLVNNAGIYPELPLLDETPQFFDRIMATNVRGMYQMTKDAARVMRDAGRGSIVCTASTCSYRAIERHAAYNVSKGAVAQLTRSLAVTLAPLSIRVNAVAPGVISAATTDVWVSTPAVWAKQRSRIPADRVGTPEEIANITTFLLSDDASYVTGAVVLADGGESAGWRDSDWVVVAADNPSRRRRTFAPRVAS